jgi:hypothetical protein
MMSEKLSEEQLEKEADAVILQMKRAQKVNYLKFGAVLMLIAVCLFGIATLLSAIPAAVMSFMGV